MIKQENEDMKKLLELYCTNEEFRNGFQDYIWNINQSKENEKETPSKPNDAVLARLEKL